VAYAGRPAPVAGISTEVCQVYQAARLSQGERGSREEDEEGDLRAVAGLLAMAVRLGLSDEHTRPADAQWPVAN
jgi:hypothetical protein